ncbi:MAG: nicotinate-nucleotide--dimethylbenzimidazole phosphoribosyltransferase, partial [Mucispirillum sp.]|nr:nicotinate-nucleotide--dimethylbenzimidazole phosphoribosyltransferase [Mucispirillum sp.]
GTGINTITKSCNTDLKLIDMGIKGGVSHKNIDNRNLMINGTNNFMKEKAIPYDIVIKAVHTGIEYAKYAYDNNYNIIGSGEIGMANTTTAAACIMSFIKSSDSGLIGRGAGLKDEQLEIKRNVIRHALIDYDLFNQEPFEVLTCVGGLDIAAMTGLYLGAAYYRIPVVIDGLISAAAALTAYNINNKTVDFMFTSHLSEEPAYIQAVNILGLEPILNLHMRLGEGSGCPVAMQIIQNACDIMNNMQTFQDINLEEEYRKDIKM